MKTKCQHLLLRIFCACVIIFSGAYGSADDTCMFSITADEVPPNIVILLDNGAEMKQVVWHADYDNSVDHSPGAGIGFLNDNGYAIVVHGVDYYLVEILDDLNADSYLNGIMADSSDIGSRTGTWTFNGSTVTLPAEASAAVDGDGVKDNVGPYRYSKNYLNWIFFSGIYTGDGTNLPHKSRFYNAKKAMLTVAKLTSNKASFGIYNFENIEGASSVQPLGMVVDNIAALPENNVLDPNFINNVNNMGTVIYSPLAEGLATIGGYYDSPSSHVVSFYCQKNFVLIVSPGMSSMDRHDDTQYLPNTLEDFDQDDSAIGEGNIEVDGTLYTIPTNLNGSTWLDDVAHYLYTHDMVRYQPGFQNVLTYTVGFMGDLENNLFLTNTSNNGNGNPNLYTTAHLDYGKYHFTAESPDDLTSVILSAVNSILSQNLTLTAPVVPVTKTMSSNKIYLAFFKPQEGNFWEGNIVKFGIDDQLEVVDIHDQPATWPNGAMKEDATPYWSTKDWADPNADNYILHSGRNIYTYLNVSKTLTHPSNRFTATNSDLTLDILGNPTHSKEDIINYIRGADVFDEDADSDTTENRSVITGDVLHSQPLVVQYNYADNSSLTMLYYGANDGMLHAVIDAQDPDLDTEGDEDHKGREAWAFIAPDHLHRLKDIVEGIGHQTFIDSSPKAYVKDVNGNGILEDDVDSNEDGVIDEEDKDKVVIVCGQRKGGSSYFALDVTYPATPRLLWRIAPNSDYYTDTVIPELGESWSEPAFGQVKMSAGDTTGTAVFFIGAGYSPDNSAGAAVIAIDVFSGAVVKKFINDGVDITAMNFSFASSVNVIDEDSNGFVDKLYVGDLGGQMWRFGQFETDAGGNSLEFPHCNEDINSWTGKVFFRAPTYVVGPTTYTRKFYYPPSVTLEKGPGPVFYDLVFMGTGDRDSACSPSTEADRIYALKDTHTSEIRTEADLVDVTDLAASPPNLNGSGDVDGNGQEDQGWFIRLVDLSGNSEGEKVLAKGIVFYKTLYITTFIPSDDPCVPGGNARLFALNYLTGEPVLSFGGGSLVRGTLIGGGIPSSPVPIITSHGEKLFISVGSTMPVDGSESVEAGILDIDPLAPAINFHYLWWREL
jgi:type IV pilus assembly protein PilY1